MPAADHATADAAFTRINEGRQRAGLGALERAVEGDSAFVPTLEFLIGCQESAEQHEELMLADIQAISLAPSALGSECGLRVVTYHIVPDLEKLRVERRIWDCFTDSRDIQDANDVSCAGRYSFITGHVKWLPAEVYHTIAEGEGMRDDFAAYIPWIEEKLKVKVLEAALGQEANLFLHLGVNPPPGCLERYGCSRYSEVGDRRFADIYISAPAEYFGQVLKHELLHSLLPMGHLPEGNYLMSVRPGDPSQTHELTPDEEKLLALYTHPYLRDGMTMEQFSRYLIIQ